MYRNLHHIMMKSFRLSAVIIVALFCFSCTCKSKSASDDEKKINEAYQQIMVRYDLPKDSLDLYYRQLENAHTAKPDFVAIKKLCKATYFRKNASFHIAISHFNSALKDLPANDSLTFSAYLGLGICYKYLGDFSTSLNYFQKSIQVSENLKDTQRLAGTYASLAQLYMEKGDEKNARECIDKVLELEKENPTDKAYLMALHTLANFEGANGNFKKAMEIDSIGIALSDKSGNDANKITFQDNIARCYLYYLKDYEKARFYFNENLKIDKKLNNPNWIADTYINLAEVATAEKNYVLSKRFLDTAVQISTKNELYASSLKAYNSLIKLYKNQGDYTTAFKIQEKYNKQYQNTINEKSEQAFAEYNVLYETEKKEKQIAESQLASKQKNLWLILLGGSIIIGLVIFRNFRIKSGHKQQQLSLENELLKEQTHSKIQEQRLEISRDLHDSLGAQLTFINSILEGLKNASSRFDETVNSKINTLSNFSESSIIELKNTLWVLNSKEIYLDDLKNKILNFIKNASEAREDVKFNFSFDVSENFNLNSKQAVNLFRAIQEIINNALKYANATEIKIDVLQNNSPTSPNADRYLNIKIADNGIGFDYEKEKNKSFGLRNIQSRITAINATMNLKTALSQGTEYLIQLKVGQ